MGLKNPFKHGRWRDDIFGRKQRARQNAKAQRLRQGVEEIQNSLDKWISVPNRKLFDLTHSKSRMEFGNKRSYL